MNTFKRKALLCVAMAALTGCAGDQAYLKAQADAAVADGNARVAEANARAEEARAVIALSSKVDAGGAGAYLVTKELKSALGNGGATRVAAVQRPRDWLDYFQAMTSAVGAIGNIAVPIITVRESGKTSRAGFDRDVRVEEARQTGETGRIGSVAQIARDVVLNRPDPSITNNYTLSGSGVIGSGTYNAPTTTTTTRTCSGGQGAPGGTTDTGGQGGTGGSGAGGTC